MSAMVSIRRGATHSTSRVTAYAAVVAALALAGIYLLSLPGDGKSGTVGNASSEEVSPRTALHQQGMASSSRLGGGGDGASKNKEQLDEEDVDPLTITSGSVSYGSKALPYYHCGPLPSHDNPDLTELVLLHGAAFTKEDWKTSGILDMLCDINNEEDEGNLSISALDLPVSADGKELGIAFDALVSGKVLSGRAAAFVSPSASGKAMVGLAELATTDSSKELTRMVKAWIPVASGAVLKASESTIKQYKTANIPILAIHGDQDGMGRQVTQRLQQLNGAKGVELSGRHPVYLDSPEEFVQEVMQFLDEEGL